MFGFRLLFAVSGGCCQVYVAPDQWSFPLRLPLPLLGINNSIDIVEGVTYPWSADLDHRVLSINISKGAASSSSRDLFLCNVTCSMFVCDVTCSTFLCDVTCSPEH